jgi:hypothetical protein
VQAGAVGRIEHEPGVAQGILDLLALVETHRAHDDIRQARPAQGFLERTALGVGPVKDRDLPQGPARSQQSLDAPSDPARLLHLAGQFLDHDGFARGLGGPQVLGLARTIVADDLARGVEDARGGAIVLLQGNDLSVRKIGLELEYIADVGPAPGIHALVVVSDHADIAVLSGQGLGQHVLGVVGVLILIHEHMLEHLLIKSPHLFVVADELASLEQEVSKIQGSGRVQLALISQVYVGSGLARGFGRGHGVDGVGLRVEQVVLGPGDDAHIHGRLAALILQAHGLHGLDHGALLVALVVDGEMLGQLKQFMMPPDEPRSESMESVHPDQAALARSQLLDAPAHLFGGLIGEGHGQDALRRHAPAQQMRYAVGDDPGLARARPSQDQQRPRGMEHAILLLGVEIREVELGAGVHGLPEIYFILFPGVPAGTWRVAGVSPFYPDRSWPPIAPSRTRSGPGAGPRRPPRPAE